MAEHDQTDTNAVIAELIAIKKLLVLALAEGTEKKIPQLQIGRVLGVGQATVSRMLSPPKRRRAPKGKRGMRVK